MKTRISKFIKTLSLILVLTLVYGQSVFATEGEFYRSELTNEWISTSLKNQRPIAAMVDNEKRALPHYGLSNADIVYEITNSLQNKGITRFMVLYKDWGNITRLGSIRSVRTTNLILAPEWNAVVCHDGGPFYINPFLANPYVDNFSGTFGRIKNGKPREFTEYIVTGDLARNFKNKKVSTSYNEFYPGAHYKFAADDIPTTLIDIPGVINCNTINLPYEKNKPYLTYNALTGLYYYHEYDSAHVDPGNNNTQLAFKNLIIQNTTYTALDPNGYLHFNCVDSN